ncbi:MAG: ABC transporter ATP-binding protein [Patescibacteria group bacterium]
MLEIKKLTKKFGNFTAVEDVNLEVKEGEFFSIIGPNGSGKTTIIKNILGLLHPTRGDVLVGNESVNKNPQLTKRKIGYIPDEPKIWSHITGEEFLYFSGSLYGMSKKEIQEKVPKLLNYFNLKSIEKKYFENYSRGNKQKFSILSALLHEPDLILVDEPIVGLDPESAEIAMKLLSDFASEGGSIFMATHTLPVAQEYSSRVGVLHKGKLVETGSVDELRKKMNNEKASLLEIYHYFSKND